MTELEELWIILSGLVVEAKKSVDILSSSTEFLFNLELDFILSLTNKSVSLRCLTSDLDSIQQAKLKKKFENKNWQFKHTKEKIPRGVIIIDKKSALLDMLNETNKEESITYEITDPTSVKEIENHFNILWNNSSITVLYENLLDPIALESEKSLVRLSSNYCKTILDSLIKNPQNFYNLSPRKFEEIIADLLSKEGLEVHLTPTTRDGGYDILACKNTIIGSHLYLIECKKYSPDRPVGVSLVRALYGVVEAKRANLGLIVTTSYFSKDAIAFKNEQKNRLSLKDYNQLVEWIKK